MTKNYRLLSNTQSPLIEIFRALRVKPFGSSYITYDNVVADRQPSGSRTCAAHYPGPTPGGLPSVIAFTIELVRVRRA